MSDKIRKCIISRYDETIKEPPFLTIPIDEIEVLEPENNDDGGVDFANRLYGACKNKGYSFKFYSLCSKRDDIDYEIVVY